MELQVSRKILSVILSVILAVGGILFFGAELVRYTFCNESYITMVFSTKAANAQCRENFLNRIEAVSAKSGIPSAVFESILDNDPPGIDDVIKRLFDGNDTSLYTEASVEQFEDLCIEYLDENHITYDKEMVYNAAVSAAEVYSDCFGIKDTGEAMPFVEKVYKNYTKFSSLGVLLVVVSIGLFLLLYKKKNAAISALSSAFTVLGAALFLIGVCGLVFGVGNSPAFAPQMYADALKKAVDGAFGISLVSGAVLTALSVFCSVRQSEKKD